MIRDYSKPMGVQSFNRVGKSDLLQRRCKCGQKKRTTEPCETCDRNQPKSLNRHSKLSAGNGEVPQIVYDVLRSDGHPLNEATRQSFEPYFGRDFSGVRVHTDHKAAKSANDIDAHAYTVGNHIVFGHGEYSPSSTRGINLLGHELTHVVQQSNASSDSIQALRIAPDDSQSEREAQSFRYEDVHRKIRPAQTKVASRSIQRFSAALKTNAADEVTEFIGRLFQSRTNKVEAQLVARGASHHALRRLFWGRFWKMVVSRFALRGAIAATLSLLEGPLPFAKLFLLGIAFYLVYEIIKEWPEIERRVWGHLAEDALNPQLETQNSKVDDQSTKETEKIAVETKTETNQKKEERCPHPIGTPSDPIDMTWFKPKSIYPQTITLGRIVYHCDRPDSLPPSTNRKNFFNTGMPIGVSNEYWPKLDKKLLLLSERDVKEGKQRKHFRQSLADNGFDWTGYQVDHVQDLQWSSIDGVPLDIPENLWPLNGDINKRAGNRQNKTQLIDYCETPKGPPRKQVSLQYLKKSITGSGRYFKITEIKEP
jgi:hypothetical protein